MVYFDTSAVVPLVLPEPSSAAVHAWVARNRGTVLALSEWTVAEFASALGVRVRTRALPPEQAGAAWVEFQDRVRDSFAVHGPTKPDFDAAADLVLRFELGLRAGDALHAAVARRTRATSLLTLDKRLAAAAAQLGLAVEQPA